MLLKLEYPTTIGVFGSVAVLAGCCSEPVEAGAEEAAELAAGFAEEVLEEHPATIRPASRAAVSFLNSLSFFFPPNNLLVIRFIDANR